MSPEVLNDLKRDAARYRFLRSRDCGPKGETVPAGLFIGLVPDNVILEGGMMERDIPAPAMNARKFALVNCAPDDWREKTNLELTGSDGGPIQSAVSFDASKMSTGALQELLEATSGQKDK